MVISDVPSTCCWFQLNAATTKIARPVVLINGKDAKKLMNLVKK